MMLPSPTLKLIRLLGGCLLAVGGIALTWALSRYESLPNYVRLAAFIPFAFGVPMFTVNDYFGGWRDLSPREKGRAIGWLFAPIIISVAAVAWYVGDPTAKA